MNIIHITPGPTVELRREPAGFKWCFRCRVKSAHEWVLLDEPPERQPTYYEPVWVCRCDQCNEDHTRFPA